MEPTGQEFTEQNRSGPVTKSWVSPLLWVLAPLTLVVAVAAGIAAAKAQNWAWVPIWSTVILSLAVVALGCIRLAEIGKLQATGLRMSQTLGGCALLFLFVIAVGVFFFVSCAMNFSIGGH
jgi:hypothetical protein